MSDIHKKIIHPIGIQASPNGPSEGSVASQIGSYAALGNVNMNSNPPAMPNRTEMVPR